MDSTGRDKGPVPVRDDVELIPLNERGVSCRSLVSPAPELFRPWSTPEKRSHNENFSHLSAIDKKNDHNKRLFRQEKRTHRQKNNDKTGGRREMLHSRLYVIRGVRKADCPVGTARQRSPKAQEVRVGCVLARTMRPWGRTIRACEHYETMIR